jgi:hypothetical protein
MDLSSIEASVLQQLKKLPGNGFFFSLGPYTAPIFGGIRTEIHIHAASFLDFNGTTLDGTAIARYGINDSIFKGYTEDRPGRIIVSVTCVAGSYSAIKTCGRYITPYVLSALGPLSVLSTGVTSDDSSEVLFGDCRSWLHEVSTTREHDGKATYFCCRMVFYVDGFLRLKIKWKKKRTSASKKNPSSNINRKKR